MWMGPELIMHAQYGYQTLPCWLSCSLEEFQLKFYPSRNRLAQKLLSACTAKHHLEMPREACGTSVVKGPWRFV